LVRFTASREVGSGQNRQSRAKLYDRLVQRYAQSWGYDVYQEDHGVGVIYELTPVKTDVTENFADGKGPGKPGDSARHGIPKNATLTQLDSIGRGEGRKAQLARWQANMRRGTHETLSRLLAYCKRLQPLSHPSNPKGTFVSKMGHTIY